MQMPRRLLTHPPCLASITFLYMSVLFPSSHHSIICILSLICANVVIICKCHTKTDYYCCEFNELGDDPPRTLQQRAKIFLENSGNNIPAGISTGDCISSPQPQKHLSSTSFYRPVVPALSPSYLLTLVTLLTNVPPHCPNMRWARFIA